MAIKKYTCPPQTASGAGTFSDNLVGFQLVQGGGLTQGNFEFTEGVTEKSNRNFITGAFSNPITLDSMGVQNIAQSREIIQNNFKVYPNFDLTQVSNFNLYGSMVKRMESSIQTIISYYPAALESTYMGINYVSGPTASNALYNPTLDQTYFELDVARLRNPFEIDFTTTSTRNLSLKEIKVSPLRDLPIEYAKYSMYFRENGYQVVGIVPTTSLTLGTLGIYVSGNPFSGQAFVYDNIIIRPNNYEVNKVFNEQFDEVENFLLNRNATPKYTAVFQVPQEAEDGTYYVSDTYVTWPLYGEWNLDIITQAFTNYLTTINNVSENFDSYKTNLISRFLTTGAFKDFDTIGQKMEKVLQIYGRSFDDTRKYITALSFMTSVNYNIGNDIPSQLLKNLAQTLGWNTNISPITNDSFLTSVFGKNESDKSHFTGVATAPTPDALNIQYFQNLVLNAAWLFKSKGTRKSIETLLRLIGAPDALVEFNEYVYLADQRINLAQFNTQFAQISGGTYVQETPVLDPTNIFSIFGVQYTGFTTNITYTDVSITREEYPMDESGFPQPPENTESFYYQIGSGWFEQTPSHRAPETPDLTNSVFTGQNPNYQTTLIPYTYGQVYLERFKNFPYMNFGYHLTPTIDNNKSWTDREIGLRSNLDGGYDARYFTTDDRLVLNVKNVDLFLNPGQGLAYDIWYMSRQYNFPIPNEGLNYVPPTYCDPYPYLEYPKRGGVDWTEINPQPGRKTFFEFAQTFWTNMINVRNRQFASNGKTMGYPTLESVYWRYLTSESLIGVENNNFNYTNMIEYVNGLGDYWIRLIEQMIPATTIWNTGVKYENSIFHRQKYVWRRQQGCQLEPVPCKPCIGVANLNPVDCPYQLVECEKYPWNVNPSIVSFGTILSQVVTSSVGDLTGCDLNGMTSEWFVELSYSGNVVNSTSFFNGVGFSIPGVSFPTTTNWDTAVTTALNSLAIYGLDYYYTINDTIVVFNVLCSVDDSGIEFKIDLKINFDLYCS